MSKLLFVPLMEKGHVHVLIGVMQHLQKAGHSLACYGVRREPVAAQFAKAGIDCIWFPKQDVDGGEQASWHKTEQLRDHRRLLRWNALGIAKCLDEKNITNLRAAVAEFKPDVMCIDPMAYHGVACAQSDGIPWAAISPLMVSAADPAWPCLWLEVMAELKPMILEKMDQLLAAGVRLSACDAVSPWLNLIFVSEEFAPRAWSNNRHAWFLGPSRPLGPRGDEPDFPWAKLRRDVPIIYVSSGGGQSLSFAPQTILSICHALSEDQAQFVCALSGLYHEDLLRQLPASCIGVRYAPQLALLEHHAAVVVTHGGMNTVSECLTHACPMLVLPLGLEQSIQAQAVVQGGFGLSLDHTAAVEHYRGALLQLLDPTQGFRAALSRLRPAYAENGAIKAAELISRLAQSKQALLPP